MTAEEPTLQSRAAVTDHPWRPWSVPRPGDLTFDGERLTFSSDDGRIFFEVALSEVRRIWSPWYQLRSGFFLKFDSQTYLVSFHRVPGLAGISGLLTRTGNPIGEALGVAGLAGSAADLITGARIGKVWLGALRAHMDGEAGGTERPPRVTEPAEPAEPSEDGPPAPDEAAPAPVLAEPAEEGPQTVASRLAFYQQAGGVVTPLLTALVAFLIGGLVVLATGHNPIRTYHAIFNGTGLNWLFPWVTGTERSDAALNLQQTLLTTTPLILTGLAVAFAFRCGMFNIGGQGQYIAGSIMAVWIGSSFAGMPGPLHIVLTIVVAALVGAAWAGIAGFLKATVGAHEVISTIMLNWIAYWVGSWLFGLGGPLQSSTATSVPVSNDVVDNAKLHVFWGDPVLQGLHVGFFVALSALVVYWVVLNRTTLGFEVRAVGFNPEAARYGGISVARNYLVAMAIAGMFAGLAGALDVLGWEFRVNVNDIQGGTTAQIGFLGIAVALLGRNTAIGTFLGALLFGALLNGTSTRHLDPSVFRPDLAGNLTLIIQGLIVLFIGADLLILYLWQARRKLRLPGAARPEAA